MKTKLQYAVIGLMFGFGFHLSGTIYNLAVTLLKAV